MNKEIILRTDASIDPSKGVGLGYEAIIYHDDGTHDSYAGSHYISKNIKTTKAEFIASTFAVKEMCDIFGEECKDYRLIVETDCEKTVSIFKETSNKKRLHRTLDILTEKFKNPTVRWISRTSNKTADSIARSTMQSGWENEQP